MRRWLFDGHGRGALPGQPFTERPARQSPLFSFNGVKWMTLLGKGRFPVPRQIRHRNLLPLRMTHNGQDRRIGRIAGRMGIAPHAQARSFRAAVVHAASGRPLLSEQQDFPGNLLQFSAGCAILLSVCGMRRKGELPGATIRIWMTRTRLRGSLCSRLRGSQGGPTVPGFSF